MTAPRNALGRGLGALLPTEPRRDGDPTGHAPLSGSGEPVGRPASLRVEQIDPNPEQPRRRFEAAQLQQLSASIARHGVLQPVVVRRAGDRFELIVGERRWRAAREAGLAEIPAVIADVAPTDRLELAIVENVQRHDLNPIELAHAYRALSRGGATQEEIGERVAMDRSSVANHLRLLDLSLDLQEDVEGGRISMGHAKALLQVAEPERRAALRDRIVLEQLSVREAERLGRDMAGPAPASRGGRPARSAAESGPQDPQIRDLAEILQRHFQARVRIHGSPQKGRIEVDYANGEDLDRITRLILEGV